MELLVIVIAFSAVMVAVVGVFLYSSSRTRRQASDTSTLATSQAQGLDVPVSLSPVIDPDICIGSLACVRACPEGDVLGLVRDRGAVIKASRCIGHGYCAQECPVNAISLVFGSAKRGIDLPVLEKGFETSRPGLYIAGELGGMGLILNAVRQGAQAAAAVVEDLGQVQCRTKEVHVVVVGAGPAGIAAAVSLHRAGLDYRVLEQETVGGAVANYPRHKVVLTRPVEIPGYGIFGQEVKTKEDLVAAFADVVQTVGLNILERVRVEDVHGEDGKFVVLTSGGKVRCRKVILAIGRRGSPARLDVPGDNLPHVAYRLIEARQYQGKRVVVVGGGDTAVESALMLADTPGTKVLLVYRGQTLNRCRQENRERLELHAADSSLRLALGCTVVSIGEQAVVVLKQGKKLKIPADYVIVNVGGSLPTGFLKKLGVGVERHFGSRPQGVAAGSTVPTANTGFRLSWGGVFLSVVAVGLVIGLWAHGEGYYSLSPEARADSPLHESLKSSGAFGHGIGLIATAVMMMNFGYAVRKRLHFMRKLGPLPLWLSLHVFVGIVTPTVIVFHAAFQLNNVLATSTAVALGVVVLTGVVGRFFLTLVPAEGGRMMRREDLSDQWQALVDQVTAGSDQKGASAELASVTRAATQEYIKLPTGALSLPALVVRMTLDAVTRHLDARALQPEFSDRADYLRFKTAYVALRRMRFQLAFFNSLRRLMGAWRIFHVILSIFLVFAIALHIGVSLALGYGLQFFQ